MVRKLQFPLPTARARDIAVDSMVAPVGQRTTLETIVLMSAVDSRFEDYQ
jgi:hypothetical protein